MTLRRLSDITIDDLLDAVPGTSLSVLPVQRVLIDVVDTDLIKARALMLGGSHTLVVRDDRLVIDESISLSKYDEYARFLKDLFVQGNLVAKTMSHVSDRAFKRDIVQRSPAEDLDIVRKLVLYDYNFMDTDSEMKKEHGVLADELEELLPEAVKEIEGFVSDVFCKAKYSGGSLIIEGRFADKVRGSLLQISRVDASKTKTTFEIRVQSSHDGEDDKTYVAFDVEDSKALTEGDYFVYGTWSKYKVANTTHLLMMCINAVKALATVLHF